MAHNIQRERTRSVLLAAQLSPLHKQPKRGKMVPRPGSTRHLEREYGQAIAALVSREVIANAFAPLMLALPELLESARRERGDSATVGDAQLADLYKIGNPADRVTAWLDAIDKQSRIDADEGKRARALVAEAKDRLKGAVSTRKIEELAEEFGRRTSTFQRIQLSKQTKAVLGADIFSGDRGMQTRLTNFASENVSLIKGILDDTSTRVEKLVTRHLTMTSNAVRGAQLHGKLAEQMQEEFGYGERRAKLIARDQIGKLYGQIDASRQRDLGVTRFIWRASDDERTREQHREWDGQIFSYDDPPIDDSTGDAVLPGEAILCRCTAEPVLSDLLDE